MKLVRSEQMHCIPAIHQLVVEQVHLLNTSQKGQSDSMINQLAHMMKLTEEKLNAIRESVERQLYRMQTDNNSKLDKMRGVVEEKLHQTLESRLSQSFKIVSERLEVVHKGLGEMQALAAGVG